MGTVGILVVASYLLATIAIGVAFRGRQESAEDYFTADGKLASRFGSVLVGFSVAATLFSGISFLSYPSLSYGGALTAVASLACFPIAYVVLRYWFLPHYLSAGYTHPYEIFERAFGVSVRYVASVLFILLRIGWMAALIYAPVIALLTMLGLDKGQWFWPLILIVGASSTFYTVLGGIRGVVATDALQFVVLFGAVIAVSGYVLVNLPVPFAEAISLAKADGMDLTFADWSLDLTAETTWTFLIGATLVNLSSWIADQMSLQRYLATRNLRDTSRAFLLNVIGSATVLASLLATGLLLALWYAVRPADDVPEAADEVLPFFIVNELPGVVAGLITAALLAATMSSMTSGINSLAGTITLDFRVKVGRPMTQRQQLRFGRVTSLVTGILATAVAGVVEQLGTIFEISQTILGVFAAPLLGGMVLAIRRSRISALAMSTAMVLSSVVGAGLVFTPLYVLWVSPAVFVLTITLAYVFNQVLPVPRPYDDHETSTDRSTLT